MSITLKESQDEAIKTIDQNLKIVATAGSGKSSTIVKRIVHILQTTDAKPENIVATTFTDKAAGELKEKIYNEYFDVTGNTNGLSNMFIGTIHSFCLDLLQKSHMKYRKYEVLDKIQSKIFMKRYYPAGTLKSIPYFKSKGKQSTLIFPKDIDPLIDTFNFAREELLSEIPEYLVEPFNIYRELLKNHNYLDYSEVLFLAYKELCKNPNLQEYVKNTIKYITVDEYQDVNTIQQAIIEVIYEMNNDLNLCVVGDDDQTIYHWRGSKINNIIEFENKFKNVKSINLEHNFRSSEGIVKTGEKVVVLNKLRIKDKNFISDNQQNYEKGDILGIRNFSNIEDENDFIVNTINHLKGSSFVDKANKYSLDYDDMVILVYSPAKLLEFNESLLKKLDNNDVKYIIEGTKNLFQTIEIKDIIYLFCYYANKYLNITLKPATLELIKDKDLTKLNLSFFTLNNDKKNKIEALFGEKSKDTETWIDFNIQEIYRKILLLLDAYDLEENHLYNFAAFSSLINDFEIIYFNQQPKFRVKNFIDFLTFDANNFYPEGWLAPNFMNTKCLKIMSIFQAKGLEYPVVFMPFLCHNYMFPPWPRNGTNKWGILNHSINPEILSLKNVYDEKKEFLNRLFYVALTRSKKYLFMSKSLVYTKPSGTTEYNKIPIPYTYALNSEYVSQDQNDLLLRNFDKENLPNISLDDQLVFDFSTIKDFFSCPYKFKLISIYGFNSPINVRMGYGKSIHNMLENIHSYYLDHGVIIENTNDLNQLIDSHLYLPYGMNLTNLVAAMKKNALIDLEQYINLNKDEFQFIEFIEQKIDYRLNDFIFINGRIDLIKNSKSKEIKIIDFKSNDEVLGEEALKKQLSIYALGYYKLTGIKPNVLESYNLKEKYPKRYTVDDKLLDETENDVNDIYSNIKNNDFSKNITQKCIDCEYRNICLE